MVLLLGYQRARNAQAIRRAPVPEMDWEMASWSLLAIFGSFLIFVGIEYGSGPVRAR